MRGTTDLQTTGMHDDDYTPPPLYIKLPVLEEGSGREASQRVDGAFWPSHVTDTVVAFLVTCSCSQCFPRMLTSAMLAVIGCPSRYTLP